MRFSRLVWAIVAASVAVLSADSWPMPRTLVFASAYGTHGFRTQPPPHSVWSGTSQGTLFTHADNGAESIVWSRELVNIPVRAFVTEDGKSVVTLDTWARLGYEHCLVIYGQEGRVVADYSLEDLLSSVDIARVLQTAGSRHWLMDGNVAFNGTQDRIVISLHWGKAIRLSLATGRVEP